MLGMWNIFFVRWRGGKSLKAAESANGKEIFHAGSAARS